MARRAFEPEGTSNRDPGSSADAGSRREHLTRARLVAAALAIVDRDGLDGLTMRALGRELGVDPMAAYHWFPNKPAILQGVAEAILSEMPLPTPDPAVPWQEIAMSMARQYHAVLLKHPNAIPVASTQPVMTPRGFELIDRTASALVASGLRPGPALELINVIAAFVIGITVVEAGVTPGSEAVSQEAIAEVYGGIDPVQFPTLAAAMVESADLLGNDAAQFDNAVDVMIRGLESSLRARGVLA
jgi:TetR/AcrR family transcriptional regulator, tetracycline repressor protein